MEKQDPLTPDSTALSKNGHPKTVLLSTGSTLFWRVFVPIFGTVFLSGFLFAFWLAEEDDLYLSFSVLWPRLLLALVLIGWLLFVRQSLWRLKRVDADDTHIYVTNYWITVRYPWEDVIRIEEKKRLSRRIVNFWLRAPGKFGQIISFLPGSFFDEWMAGRENKRMTEE